MHRIFFAANMSASSHDGPQHAHGDGVSVAQPTHGDGGSDGKWRDKNAKHKASIIADLKDHCSQVMILQEVGTQLFDNIAEAAECRQFGQSGSNGEGTGHGVVAGPGG